MEAHYLFRPGLCLDGPNPDRPTCVYNSSGFVHVFSGVGSSGSSQNPCRAASNFDDSIRRYSELACPKDTITRRLEKDSGLCDAGNALGNQPERDSILYREKYGTRL
ncbi:MAG: hypothetical protein F6K56_32070 [Moorea sp. SIO3G5]|nr:hypothetical protein [Moorena sp. SIO3G5]